MSLARAFTIKREKEQQPANLHVGRAASTRNGRPVKRSQISAPVALISSTNALSYDAPDLPTARRLHLRSVTGSSGTSTSSSSSDESDAPSLSFDGTDRDSIDDSPATPEPNHLSCYFKPAVDTKTPHRSPVISSHSSFDAPSIPQRVPSHSKKAHEFVHRKRSVQRLMSPPASQVQRNSSDFFSNWSQPVEAPPQETTPSSENPFGNELAQLDVVAEEMSHAVCDAAAQEDQHIMQTYGLALLGANDYTSEIGGLVHDYLLDEPVWI